MKRLYVRLTYRGTGAGRAIVCRIIEEAAHIGYKRMRLATVRARTQAAIALYTALGFVEIEPYRENPTEGTLFMELELSTKAGPPARGTQRVQARPKRHTSGGQKKTAARAPA